jgi:glutamate dehydrogenase (NADP+)
MKTIITAFFTFLTLAISTCTAAPFLHDIQTKYAHQPTFLQAVQEMANSLQPLFEHETKGPLYQKAFLILLEPERTISFKVPWEDDQGVLHINRGWRVEFSSALGPYKGGLRFHPTVDEGILKFLGFEQMFKNALTGLPLGGGKGGSDFDPKRKSQQEIKRFCQSFMTELYRFLHPSTDVPAGDIGVGGREIGYLMGQYKRITNRHGEGVLTGKSVNIGGSYIRPEATGYGLVYIAKLAIQDKYGEDLKGKVCAVSGSGNVSQFACQKLLEFGAKVVTVSDSNGVLFFGEGMTREDLEVIMKAKQVDRSRLSEIEDQVSGRYLDGVSPWMLPEKMEYAFPCATQNEIDGSCIQQMISNGLKGLFEGANLPTELEAQEVIKEHGNFLYIPGKAANAGGVGVSGFEMTQNAQKMSWKPEVVDEKLQELMAGIYSQLVEAAGEHGTLESGANQAGFKKVVAAMEDLGWL